MNKYQKTLITIASIATLALAVPAMAQSQGGQGDQQQGGGFGGFFSSLFHMGGNNQDGQNPQGQPPAGANHMGMRGQPGVVGSVTSISGTTIMVQSKRPNATSTYTIDASSATVFKANATSSVSSIAVGDTIFVQGTVSGTNVTATTIRDGLVMRGAPGMMGGRGGRPSATSSREMMGGPAISFQGNGQPIVAGSITSINGNSVAITNKSNVSYTVDVSSANIQKQGTGTTTVSSLVVGDSILVQGSVNGSAITASTVIDQGVPANTTPNTNQNPSGFVGGILGSIGHFFSHIFGF